MWAADPEYTHLTRTVAGGPIIHVIYNNDDAHLRKVYDGLAADKKKDFAAADAYVKDFHEQWKR